MPGNNNVKSVLDTKPLTFTLKHKNNGAKWKCTLHSDRNQYEKRLNSNPSNGADRVDSDLSTSSAGSSH